MQKRTLGLLTLTVLFGLEVSGREPIKSLLLGVFFFSVGSQLDLKAMIAAPGAIVVTTVGLLALQAAVEKVA